MEKVLVTGSAGFVGGYLVNELLDKNFQVVGLDNLSKYGSVSRDSDSNQMYTFIQGDARDFSLMYDLMKDCDYVIANAALIGGITYFHTYAYDLLSTNEQIMSSTCDAAIRIFSEKGKLKKVTYISSSMVFENSDFWPNKEGDQLVIPPPSSSYGFQKLAVEYYAKAAWSQYKLPYTICRPFNCVGIGEKRASKSSTIKSGNIELALSHVVPDIVQKILKGQNPVRIFGDGNQIRHYTYGGDLADGIVKTLKNPKAFNEDFNISTSQSTSVRELVETIWRKIHGDAPLQVISEPPYLYDVQKRIPDVSKAKNVLGFEATTTLDDMLDEVIPWISGAISRGEI
jgi:UDP-glucose 4-epimerase